MTKERKRKRLGDKCLHCGTTEDLTLDHIIPRQLMDILNIKLPEKQNLQLLCKPCNVKKGNTLQTNNPQTAILLNKAIQIWNTLHKHKRQTRNYVFRTLTVESLTPNPTYFVSHREYLKGIYKGPRKITTNKEWLEGEMYDLV